MSYTTPAGTPGSAGQWEFFTGEEAAAADAITARIIPGEPGSPGAREAGAVRYIDRALARAYPGLGPLYREGLARLDALSRARHGRVFAGLGAAEQDALLTALGDDPRSGYLDDVGEETASLLGRLFAVVWEHTIQGVFGDPVYGGNRDCVGWKLIGFPGAQWGYDAAQMRPGYDAATIPVKTLGQLRREVSAAERDRAAARRRAGA